MTKFCLIFCISVFLAIFSSSRSTEGIQQVRRKIAHLKKVSGTENLFLHIPLTITEQNWINSDGQCWTKAVETEQCCACCSKQAWILEPTIYKSGIFYTIKLSDNDDSDLHLSIGDGHCPPVQRRWEILEPISGSQTQIGQDIDEKWKIFRDFDSQLCLTAPAEPIGSMAKLVKCNFTNEDQKWYIVKCP